MTAEDLQTRFGVSPSSSVHSRLRLRKQHGLLPGPAGIAFVGVHDSFWTHAGDVPVLNRVLREAFVDLHSRPLLQQLREGLIWRYPDIDPSEFPEIPPLGDLDLEQVLESDYFFN